MIRVSVERSEINCLLRRLNEVRLLRSLMISKFADSAAIVIVVHFVLYLDMCCFLKLL